LAGLSETAFAFFSILTVASALANFTIEGEEGVSNSREKKGNKILLTLG
jgi:hypothetical protein